MTWEWSVTRRWALVTVALAALCWMGASPARAEKLLRWKLQPGQTLRVSFAQTTNTETPGTGRPMGVTIDMLVEMTWHVEDVDENGTARLSQSFDRLKIAMKSGTLEPIEYDSASAEAPSDSAREIAQAVGPLIGVKFHVTMSDRGEMLDVKLSDEAAGAIADSPAAGGLKQLLSAKGIDQVVRRSAVVLPEKPVAEGYQWTVDREVESPIGTMKQQTTYTYEGTAERGAEALEKITFQSTLNLPAPSRSAPTALTLKDQQHAGVLWFDAHRGRFAESEMTQKMTTQRPYRDMMIRVRTSSSMNMKIRDQ